MAALWYPGSSAALAAAGCWDVDLSRAPGGRGVLALLTQAAAGAPLRVSVANPHAAGGTAALRVSGAWAGAACAPAGGKASVATVVLPDDGRRPPGRTAWSVGRASGRRRSLGRTARCGAGRGSRRARGG